MKKPLKNTIFSLIIGSTVLITLAAAYYFYMYNEITQSKFVLIENQLIVTNKPGPELKEQSCKDYLKINLPANFTSYKNTDLTNENFCFFIDSTHKKSISLSVYSLEWKKSIENQSNFLSKYNSTILSSSTSKLKEEYQKEQLYFLKNKLIFDYFQSFFTRWIFPSEAAANLQMSNTFLLMRGNIYYQKLTNSYILKNSPTTKYPSKINYLFFDFNNNVVSLMTENLSQAEIDSIFSSLASKGIQLDFEKYASEVKR